MDVRGRKYFTVCLRVCVWLVLGLVCVFLSACVCFFLCFVLVRMITRCGCLAYVALCISSKIRTWVDVT